MARSPGRRAACPAAASCGAAGAGAGAARMSPSGMTWARAQHAVAASTARRLTSAARTEPHTGPITHPAVNAMRTMEMTPSSAGLAVALISSWTAANS
jgi:hypothetical protein